MLRVLAFIFTLTFPLLTLSAPRYPIITETQGQGWVTGKDGKKQTAKKKQNLIEKALIETGLNSQVKVDIDGVRSFIVKEGSEVFLPAISWESGEAPLIIIKKGALRWQQPVGEKNKYNIALRSDLFEFIPPAGDYVFIFDPEKASCEVQVFEGSIQFSAMNAEESLTVKTGQRAGFQGVRENGGVAYDVLLKGKKIPRGNLTEVKALDANDLKLEQARLAAVKKEEARKKALIEQGKAKALQQGFICGKPAGKLNDCSWTCEGNPKSEKKKCLVENDKVSCVRRRCNANGEWSESTPLTQEEGATLCKPTITIGTCNY